jgi:hypothetical protein
VDFIIDSLRGKRALGVRKTQLRAEDEESKKNGFHGKPFSFMISPY